MTTPLCTVPLDAPGLPACGRELPCPLHPYTLESAAEAKRAPSEGAPPAPERCAPNCKGIVLAGPMYSGCSCYEGKLANGDPQPPGFVCDCPKHPSPRAQGTDAEALGSYEHRPDCLGWEDCRCFPTPEVRRLTAERERWLDLLVDVWEQFCLHPRERPDLSHDGCLSTLEDVAAVLLREKRLEHGDVQGKDWLRVVPRPDTVSEREEADFAQRLGAERPSPADGSDAGGDGRGSPAEWVVCDVCAAEVEAETAAVMCGDCASEADSVSHATEDDRRVFRGLLSVAAVHLGHYKFEHGDTLLRGYTTTDLCDEIRDNLTARVTADDAPRAEPVQPGASPPSATEPAVPRLLKSEPSASAASPSGATAQGALTPERREQLRDLYQPISHEEVLALLDGLSAAEQSAERMAEALDDLVSLKDRKDRVGKDAVYERRQPLAWEAARAALSAFEAGRATKGKS